VEEYPKYSTTVITEDLRDDSLLMSAEVVRWPTMMYSIF
jgi:hypothetical protein